MQYKTAFAFFERKRHELSNPKHRQYLELFQEHMRAELAGDVDRVMKTLVPEPVYHFWGYPDWDEEFTGQSATRAFYSALLPSVVDADFDYRRIIIDDFGFVGDGISEAIFKGAELLRTGAPKVLEMEIDPEARYQSSRQRALIIPFRDGLMAGEDIYSDGPPTIKRID
jgi:hypothetical protein